MIYTYTLSVDPNKEEALRSIVCKKLDVKAEDLKDFTIRKKSIDARHKPEIVYNFTVSFKTGDPHLEKRIKRSGAKPAEGEKKYAFPGLKEEGSALYTSGVQTGSSRKQPIIVGFGPAGMFAAYALAKAGLNPVVLERGSRMDERIKAVSAFHKGGVLLSNCNVQFGEGGAGTFSDGKLNTGVKDKSGRNEAVLRTFYEFGADLDITYDGRAHMGTDVIRKVVVNMRTEIERLGGTVLFDSKFTRPEIRNGKVTGVYYENTSLSASEGSGEAGKKTGSVNYLETDTLVLAIGHSSRDTYEMLHDAKFSMEAKSFAVGFRVLHEADFINESQYGRGYREKYPKLPTAYYKLAKTTSFDRNVYSFCMCPGGVVVNASSEANRLCINGMSNKAREGLYSNAAIVLNVGPKDFESMGYTGILAGMEFQRKLEEKAYILGNGVIPVQFYQSFKENLTDEIKNDRFVSMIREGMQGKALYANLRELFPDSMNQAFIEGMEYFNTCIRGYTDENPLLAGVEARTSAPIRILRTDEFQSPDAGGIYPCGEGAGYAGGIMSAAMDGLKVAEAILSRKQ